MNTTRERADQRPIAFVAALADGPTYDSPERRRSTNSYAGPARRKSGPPSLQRGQPTSPLHVRVPAQLLDLVCQLALARGQSVSAVIRAALSRYTRREYGHRHGTSRGS